MSLAITLSNALSGLAANQSALQVTSNNVANANTEGYARKTVDLESRLLDGIGSGVPGEERRRSAVRAGSALHLVCRTRGNNRRRTGHGAGLALPG